MVYEGNGIQRPGTLNPLNSARTPTEETGLHAFSLIEGSWRIRSLPNDVSSNIIAASFQEIHRFNYQVLV